MNRPETFAEWSLLFDDFKRRINDEESFHAAFDGSFDPNCGTADMWAEEYLGALNERLRSAQKRFERDLSHAHSDTEIQAALGSLKRELKLIYRFASLPCTENIESLDDCRGIVIKAAESIESSLLSSSAADRSGKLAVFIKNARLTKLSE